MKRYASVWLAFALCLAAGTARADSRSVTVVNSTVPGEVRYYEADIAMKGQTIPLDAKEPVDLEATIFLFLRHKYGKRDSQGALLVEVSLVRGEFRLKEEKMALSPDLYPKLSYLLDKQWRVSEFFGLAQRRSLPGINYGNMIILFYLLGADEPKAVGDKWDYTVSIPGYNDRYNIANTLQRVEKIEGVEAAVVRQEIVTLPADGQARAESSFKSSGESVFATADGRLLKAKVDCVAVAGQESTPVTTNITLDIRQVTADKAAN